MRPPTYVVGGGRKDGYPWGGPQHAAIRDLAWAWVGGGGRRHLESRAGTRPPHRSARRIGGGEEESRFTQGCRLWRRGHRGRPVKAPALGSGSLAGSRAAAGGPSQIPGETSEEERASANMQPLLSSREAPEVDLRPAGSGLVEVLLDSASFPQPWVLTSGAPGAGRGHNGIREQMEGTRLTGSPEAVPAQRQRRSLGTSASPWPVPDARSVAVGGAEFVST